MHLPDSFVRVFHGVLGLLLCFPSIGVSAQGDDDQPEPEDLVPGLIVEWMPMEDDQPRVVRVASTLVDDWGEASPDLRIPLEGFRTSWSGWLLIREPGDYAFRIESDGPVRLVVGDRVVESKGGAEFLAEPLAMRPGLVSIRVSSEHQGTDRRIVIDWKGPSFGFEHLPPSQMFHEAIHTPTEDPVEIGRRLADQIGCANCHAISGFTPRSNVGPALTDVHSIQSDWLLDWLIDPQHQRSGTPMPGFRLDEQQAADVVAALSAVTEKVPDLDREAQMAINVADPGRGQLVFRSAGCLGCHTRGAGERAHAIQLAPDLENLGTKRTLVAVVKFLASPSRSQRGRHRPELGLSTDAAAHLAAYLTSGGSKRLADVEEPHPVGNSDRGRALIDAVGCRSCHEIPGVMELKSAVPLDRTANLQEGCLSQEPPFGVPEFGFVDDQRQALRSFLAQRVKRSTPTSSWTHATDALRRHNCLGCHSRNGQGGEEFGVQLARSLAEDRELNALKGTLTPPDLSQVGAKLKPEMLELAIRGQAPTARPWLSVRMPRFEFEPGDAEAIAAYLRDFDRVVPDQHAAPTPSRLGPDVGIRLLGRQGFGCLSCHVLDGKIPPGGEAETLGPDLALAHQRMSKTYFDRWLSDPQRILPGTAMPQFLLPVPGVEGTISEQLEAVWDALGDPRLVEIASTSTRQFLVRQGDRALVVRDMIVPEGTPQAYYPRGLAIGLKGNHSVLFDADRLNWIQWWDEGFLSRTKEGRLWEWHPEGRNLWVTQNALPPVLLHQDEGRYLLPELRRERFGTFGELSFEGNGVRLQYDLSIRDQASLRVIEAIDPTEDGWVRRVQVANVPGGMTPVILAVEGQTWSIVDDVLATNREGTIDVEIDPPAVWVSSKNDPLLNDSILVEPKLQQDGSWIGTLRTRIRPR